MRHMTPDDETKPRTGTVFHATTVPDVSVEDYLARIAKYSHASSYTMVLALIYASRICNNSANEMEIHPRSIHRLLLSTTLVAAKFHDDAFASNAWYSKVGGVVMEEINRLERA